MIKLENTDVYGFEAAIRGMRNAYESWDKSDSLPAFLCEDEQFHIGENDLKLMKSLSKAGNDHGKFLRMINVTVDITAPLYWWKEFDTYKVGTVANSCSTMHKIHAKEFTLDDFSCEHLMEFSDYEDEAKQFTPDRLCNFKFYMMDTIVALNNARELYLAADNKLKRSYLTEAERKHVTAQKKRFWWQMIQLLPTSYNQKRTVQLNYQVLKSMYFARRNHKLDCWRTLCDWTLTLPYFKGVCVDVVDNP